MGNYSEIRNAKIAQKESQSDSFASAAEDSPIEVGSDVPGVPGVPGVNELELELEGEGEGEGELEKVEIETISSNRGKEEEAKELKLDDNKREITEPDSKSHIPHYPEIDPPVTDNDQHQPHQPHQPHQRSKERMIRVKGISEMREREVSIEEIKNINLKEFLTHQYGMKFSPSGGQHVCLSPFTKEQKPSFIVGYLNDHWLFKDFSSGYGGSLIDFVLKRENLCDVSEALAYLRKLIANGGFEWSLRSVGLGLVGNRNRTSENESKGSKGDYNLNYIYRKLCSGDDKGRDVCRKYLLRRCIDEELVSELFSRGILLHNWYKGHSYCCFAVFDLNGELCCLDNHRIDPEEQIEQVRPEGKGKFVLGKKRIFTLDWEILSCADKIFISEGIIDYLSMKTLEPQLPGLALLGNNLNFEEALIKSVRVIVSALDFDAGGVRALLSLKNKFPIKEISPYNLVGCKDPNEYLQMLMLGKKVKKYGSTILRKQRNPVMAYDGVSPSSSQAINGGLPMGLK